jgi:HAE1 family hydrophobic/amphiphilic exporter-1
VLQPLDVLTMLGFIMLVGTVVNNPILIVEQSLVHVKEDGLPIGVAVVESVRTRIRPIFMTTLGGLVGLLPLVLAPGAGSELYRGIGAVLLGGLLISTAVTLVFVPALLSLMMEGREALRQRLFPAVASLAAGSEPVVTRLSSREEREEEEAPLSSARH